MFIFCCWLFLVASVITTYDCRIKLVIQSNYVWSYKQTKYWLPKSRRNLVQDCLLDILNICLFLLLPFFVKVFSFQNSSKLFSAIKFYAFKLKTVSGVGQLSILEYTLETHMWYQDPLRFIFPLLWISCLYFSMNSSNASKWNLRWLFSSW